MTDREKQAEAIYKAYPRKAAKPRALKAIKMALNRVPLRVGRSPYEVLLEAANEMRRLLEPFKDDDEKKRLVPHPATFFNGDMWNDLADFRLRFPLPKKFYYGTVTPRPGCYARYPCDAVNEWIEAGKTPEEAKRLAVKVYR